MNEKKDSKDSNDSKDSRDSRFDEYYEALMRRRQNQRRRTRHGTSTRSNRFSSYLPRSIATQKAVWSSQFFCVYIVGVVIFSFLFIFIHKWFYNDGEVYSSSLEDQVNPAPWYVVGPLRSKRLMDDEED